MRQSEIRSARLEALQSMFPGEWDIPIEPQRHALVTRNPNNDDYWIGTYGKEGLLLSDAQDGVNENWWPVMAIDLDLGHKCAVRVDIKAALVPSSRAWHDENPLPWERCPTCNGRKVVCNDKDWDGDPETRPDTIDCPTCSA